MDLSRQTNLSITQQSNFVRLGEDNGATMFFIAEKQQKTILNFSLDSFRFISQVLCDYNNAYILVRGDVTVVGDNLTQLAFKNCIIYKVYHKN